MGVYKQKGSDYWYLDYYDSHGERQRPCSNTENKAEAKIQLAKLLVQVSDKKKGLEVHVPNGRVTLSDAWLRYLNEWCPEASLYSEWGRYHSNIEDTQLGNTDLSEITSDMLEKWLAAKLKADPKTGKKAQKASTVNTHRRKMRRVFNCLIKKNLWKGLNPVVHTPVLFEPVRPYELLTEEEFLRVASFLPERYGDISVLGYYTGLRRGELYALRKDRSVVDLERATITPRASNQFDRTKGKKIKTIPLTPKAVEILKKAWAVAMPGDVLFPWKDGEMRTKNQRPSDIIRTAMKRAGMVEYWEHHCATRNSCKKVMQKHLDEQQRKCPNCDHILIPKAVVRKVRFHDLRHSLLTNMINDGVPLRSVSKMGRHHDLNFTDKTYVHGDTEDLRRDITPKRVDERLAELARGQSPEVAAVLAEAQEKLAAALEKQTNRSYIGHTDQNVVQIQSRKKAKS